MLECKNKQVQTLQQHSHGNNVDRGALESAHSFVDTVHLYHSSIPLLLLHEFVNTRRLSVGFTTADCHVVHTAV